MSDLKKLFKQALEARNNAYAPYSNFKVGAALITKKGHIYKGANAENVSYPCGTCAEAGAIAAMVSAGEYEIAEIVVVADSQNPIMPCGACLQRILEFSDKDTIVHSADLNGVHQSYRIGELLPFSFHEDLKND